MSAGSTTRVYSQSTCLPAGTFPFAQYAAGAGHAGSVSSTRWRSSKEGERNAEQAVQQNVTQRPWRSVHGYAVMVPRPTPKRQLCHMHPAHTKASPPSMAWSEYLSCMNPCRPGSHLHEAVENVLQVMPLDEVVGLEHDSLVDAQLADPTQEKGHIVTGLHAACG